MKKIAFLTISILVMQSCVNKNSKPKLSAPKKEKIELFAYLKNVYEVDKKVFVEMDLIEVDKYNNINNQDSKIEKFRVVDSLGLENLKIEFLNNKDEFQETNEIFQFKINSNREIIRINRQKLKKQNEK